MFRVRKEERIQKVCFRIYRACKGAGFVYELLSPESSTLPRGQGFRV